MPKYKNLSSEVLIFNSVQFKPLEEKEVNFYVDTSDNKMKMTSEDPIWSPVAYSEQLSSGSMKVTENLVEGVNLLRISPMSNSAVVSFNSKESPKAAISLGESLVVRPVGRINEVFVHNGEVSIELWREFNWRG